MFRDGWGCGEGDALANARVECPSFSLAHIPRPGGLHLSRCPGKLDPHNVFDYIEGFYSRVRRHSHLDQLSPMNFEQLRTGS